MITLFTHYFDALEYMLGRILELLTLCICQENDTIARIGSNCLQQLILQNVAKFQPEHWNKVVGAFVELFSKTTAYELFTAAASIPSKPTIPPKPAHGEANTNGDVVPDPAEPTSAEENHADSPKINGLRTGSSEHEDGDMPTPQTPELEDYRPQVEMQQQQPAAVTVARRRFFNRIITNCVLQLLMIETVHELFSNDKVYEQIPSN